MISCICATWLVDFYYPLGHVYRDKFSLIQHIRNNRLIAISLCNRQGTIITRWQPFTDQSFEAILAAYEMELVKRVGTMIDSPINQDKRYCWCDVQKKWVMPDEMKSSR